MGNFGACKGCRHTMYTPVDFTSEKQLEVNFDIDHLLETYCYKIIQCKLVVLGKDDLSIERSCLHLHGRSPYMN